MNNTLFATPLDAEMAFYRAFAHRDLEAMMAVWSDDDENYCIHPNDIRLSGLMAIRESWRALFATNTKLQFMLSQRQVIHSGMLAVHNLYEQITIIGQTSTPQPLLATNIYLRGNLGWRMVAHHAAPAISIDTTQAAPDRKPPSTTLH